MKKIRLKMKVLKDFISYQGVPTEYEMFIPMNECTKVMDNVYIINKPSSEFVHKTNGVFAVCTKNTDGMRFIITDEFFDILPDMVKRFTLYHELGHIFNDHEYTKKDMVKREFGMLLQHEKEADKFAAETIGYKNAMKSLYWLIRNTDLPFISKLEMMKRIRNLRSLQVE